MSTYKRTISRKFTPGQTITGVAELIQARDNGHWIFFGSWEKRNWGTPRVYHPQWICNMNFNCVMSYIDNNVLRLAVRNPAYPYVFKAEWMASNSPEVSSSWWITCSEIPNVKISALNKRSAVDQCKRACEVWAQSKKFVIQYGAKETCVAPVPLLK